MSNESKRLPEPYQFITDECLGLGLARTLRAAGWDVIPFGTRFSRGADDTVWLPLAGRERLIVLSKDGRITSRPNEAEAILSAGCAAFLLGRAGMSGDAMVEAFLTAKRAMWQLLAETEAPFIAAVSSTGRVELRITSDGARHKPGASKKK